MFAETILGVRADSKLVDGARDQGAVPVQSKEEEQPSTDLANDAVRRRQRSRRVLSPPRAQRQDYQLDASSRLAQQAAFCRVTKGLAYGSEQWSRLMLAMLDRLCLAVCLDDLAGLFACLYNHLAE